MLNRPQEIREKSGMSRAAFCRKYGMPIRTMEEWEAGRRVPPDYIMDWLERIVMEDLSKND